MLANSHDIAVLRGDGIGPEVVEATFELLRAVEQRHAIGLAFTALRARVVC
jgi:isocitrate/isopropylmalate dehydrogenase